MKWREEIQTTSKKKLKGDFMEQIYRWIEVLSARINLWAWKKKVGPLSQSEWAKGYREWKKRKCPHN